MAEGDQGTRRYKWFRPRQAARGQGFISGPTNYGTVALWNSSTAAQIMVVRALRVLTSSQDTPSVCYLQGSIGGTAGVVQPLVPGDAAPPGKITSLDDATQITPDWWFSLPSSGDDWWPHNFPFAILLPNWSLVVQANSKAENCRVSFLWESITEDQLDYFWEWIG